MSAPTTPCDLLALADDCPNCQNQGWYVVANRNTGEPEQQQCEWCYTVKNSRFNIDQIIARTTSEIAAVPPDDRVDDGLRSEALDRRDDKYGLTPRTDEMVTRIDGHAPLVDADFARLLERELDLVERRLAHSEELRTGLVEKIHSATTADWNAAIAAAAIEAERVASDEETGKVAAYSCDKIRAGMMGARIAAEAIRALKKAPPSTTSEPK